MPEQAANSAARSGLFFTFVRRASIEAETRWLPGTTDSLMFPLTTLLARNLLSAAAEDPHENIEGQFDRLVDRMNSGYDAHVNLLLAREPDAGDETGPKIDHSPVDARHVAVRIKHGRPSARSVRTRMKAFLGRFRREDNAVFRDTGGTRR